MTDILFEKIKIGALELKNRIYMPAMHMNMANNFEVTDRLVDFYAERARGGVGAIVVGYATVDEFSGNLANIGAHDDKYIDGLSRLAEAIKSNGSAAAVQLNHAGRYNYSFFLNGRQAVAPSAVPSRMTKETPRELSLDEIKKIVADFGEAAGRVKRAGYDFVEVLSGTGYLISQFLSENTNKRTDEYGGDFESRMKFGLEIVAEIKKVTGADFPLVFRINGNEFMPGGLGRTELQTFAQRLVAAGVNGLCINVGWHEARVPQIVTEVPRGVFGYLAGGIKALVDVPVIASHRINDPELAREMIEDDFCDMVAMGRALIADPYLPKKAAEHKEGELVHCIACAQGCFDNLFKLKAVECLCNPAAGHEKDRAIEKTAAPKKVMVIGGGAAGLSAAAAAFDRGHNVTIFEMSGRLGGQLFIAGAPPGRDEFAELAVDLAAQVNSRGIKVVLNTVVDEKLIADEKPDHIIVATGARPIAPPISGSDAAHVVQAWDVLEGKKRVGKNVVIIGGGAVGVETAIHVAEIGSLSGDAVKFLLLNKAETPETISELASRGTKNVVLIEMIEKIGKDIGKSTRWGMLQNVDRANIDYRTATKAIEIGAKSITVEEEGKSVELPADTVILAIGAASYNPLAGTVKETGIPFSVIGDAKKVAKAFDAIHEGYETGRAI